jgi:hypothetical protein
VEYPEIDGPRKGIGTLQKVVSWEGRTHSRGPGSLVRSGNPVGQAPPRVRRTPPLGRRSLLGRRSSGVAKRHWWDEACRVGRSPRVGAAQEERNHCRMKFPVFELRPACVAECMWWGEALQVGWCPGRDDCHMCFGAHQVGRSPWRREAPTWDGYPL